MRCDSQRCVAIMNNKYMEKEIMKQENKKNRNDVGIAQRVQKIRVDHYNNKNVILIHHFHTSGSLAQHWH